MWKTILLAVSVAAVAGCSSGPAPRSAPRTVTVVSAPAAATTASIHIALSAEQAALVRPYLGRAPAGNGRRHVRSGGLPPGIAKNLARGKALPPGIAKTYLPAHVVAGLPRLPSGLDYVIVAGKLLLVEAATAAIHDVLLDAAFDR